MVILPQRFVAVKDEDASMNLPESGLGDVGAEAGSGASLSKRNNCNNTLQGVVTLGSFGSELQQLKSCYALQVELAGLERDGLRNQLGFVTLTLNPQTDSSVEAQRRFHSLAQRVLPKHFGACVVVFERHRSGAIHYHMIADCKADIRTGFNWDEVRAGNYRSASAALRDLWSSLRRDLPKYGFGRHEVMPVRNVEALSVYVAKYFHKERGDDKGVRKVRYLGFRVRRASQVFSFTSERSRLFRLAVGKFCKTGRVNEDFMRKILGKRWFQEIAHWSATGCDKQYVYEKVNQYFGANSRSGVWVNPGVPLRCRKGSPSVSGAGIPF